MQLNKAVSLTLFLTAAAVTAAAQNLAIDDFTTGAYQSPAYYSGSSNPSTQTGSMMGRSRSTNMNVCVSAYCSTQNPYNQPSTYGFFAKTATQPAAMVQTAGYYASPRIDMGYGFGSHMDEPFQGYQKIRLTARGRTSKILQLWMEAGKAKRS